MLFRSDSSLQSRISAEESTRSAGDSSLTTRISSEESVRDAADVSLTTRLSTEESARSAGDSSLTTRLSTEESVRSSADASLVSRLSTEESARVAGDNSLDSRLDTIDSTILVINGTANEVTVAGTFALGSSNTFTIGLPDNVEIAGNLGVTGSLSVKGNATLGDANSDLVKVQGQFRIPVFSVTAGTYPAIPADYMTTPENYIGHMFYLTGSGDANWAQGNKWYFNEGGEWFASPFFAE